MTDQTHAALDRLLSPLLDDIPVGPAPVDELLTRGRAARRRRRVAIGTSAMAVLVIWGSVSATNGLMPSQGGTDDSLVADASPGTPNPDEVPALTCRDRLDRSLLQEDTAPGAGTPVGAAEALLQAGERAEVAEQTGDTAIVVVSREGEATALLSMFDHGQGWVLSSVTRCMP